jgi:[acyl-carrier-protein] S-malonyltransferase
VRFAAPRAVVFANVTAQPHGDASSVKRSLVDQIVRPVRWEQTMHQLVSQGDARWIELAPGRVLTGLLRKINRRLPVETLASADVLTHRTE